MRINSPKQTGASRENGSKSKGPKSKAGKSKSAQNAVREGLFSRQVVIQALGEKLADFDAVKRRLWEVLKPSNSLEEMLVMDFVENWWRRERIRRSEEIEWRTRLLVLDLTKGEDNKDRVEALSARFYVLLGEYQTAISSRAAKDISQIQAELEQIREELVSTSVGLSFLIKALDYLAKKALDDGVLAPSGEVLLQGCLGFGSEAARACLALNAQNRKEFEKAARNTDSSTSPPDKRRSEREIDISRIAAALRQDVKKAREEAGQKATTPRAGDNSGEASSKPEGDAVKPNNTEAADVKSQDKESYRKLLAQGLSVIIRSYRAPLKTKRARLKLIESIEAEARPAWAVLDPSVSDRFSRAETAVERRMYRALAALTTIRAQGISNLLPEPTNSKRAA